MEIVARDHNKIEIAAREGVIAKAMATTSNNEIDFIAIPQQIFQMSTRPKLEKKESGKNYSISEKVQILEKLEGKSKKESERELAKISPVAVVPKEFLRAVTGEQNLLQVTIDSELLVKLNRIRQLISHKNPNPSYAELLHEMADLVLKTKNAERSGATVQNKVDTDEFAVPPVEVEALKKEELKIQMGAPRSRYIPNKIKLYVWRRDQGQCSYVHPETQKRCASRHFIQIDHILEFSKGRSSLNPQNLRLLCGAHNRTRRRGPIQ